MSVPRRDKDSRRTVKLDNSLGKMGKALGWGRSTHQGVQKAHQDADAEKVSKGIYAKGSFVPGAGHVNDEAPHRGWLGIGGDRTDFNKYGVQ